MEIVKEALFFIVGSGLVGMIGGIGLQKLLDYTKSTETKKDEAVLLGLIRGIETTFDKADFGKTEDILTEILENTKATEFDTKKAEEKLEQEINLSKDGLE